MPKDNMIISENFFKILLSLVYNKKTAFLQYLILIFNLKNSKDFKKNLSLYNINSFRSNFF